MSYLGPLIPWPAGPPYHWWERSSAMAGMVKVYGRKVGAVWIYKTVYDYDTSTWRIRS